MAKQVIGIGAIANDGTGDTLRDAMDKVNDNFTELYDADDNYRCAGIVAVTVGEHTIAFSSTLGTIDINVEINDYNGLGVTLISWTATGFTYNALTAGNIGYKATKNK